MDAVFNLQTTIMRFQMQVSFGCKQPSKVIVVYSYPFLLYSASDKRSCSIRYGIPSSLFLYSSSFSSSANDFSVAASSFSSGFSITPFCRRSNDCLTTSSNPMCIFVSIGFASEISRLTAHDLPAVQNSSLDYLQPLYPGSGSCPCLSRYSAPSLRQQLSGRTVPATVPEILYGV